MDDSIKPIAGGFGGAVLVGVAADRLHFSGQSAGALISGTQALVSAVMTAHQSKKRSPAERIEHIIRPHHSWPPFLIAFLVFSILQFLINLVGFILGASIGLAFALANTSIDSKTMTDAAVESASIIVLLVTIVATVFIAKRASYYIAHHVLLWLSGALLLSGVSNIVLNGLFLDIPIWQVIVGQVVLFLILLGASAVGYQRAKKTYRRFIMLQGFGHLTPAQQEVLTAELTRLLESQKEGSPRSIPTAGRQSTTPAP